MSGFDGMVSLRPAQALPTDTNASLGEVAGATFAETLASNPSTAYYREKYLENAYALSPDTIDAPSARQRLKSEGMEGRLQIPDQGIPRYALDTLIDRKREEMKRQDILARAPSGIASNSVRLAVGMGGSLLDPLNVAAGFFPVVGEARYAQLLARAPLGIIGRTAVRAGVGAAEGTVGAAAIEPIVASSKHADQADYSMADSISNIAFGGVFGAGLHTMGGALGDLGRTIRGGAADIAANVDPATRATALKTAVAQAASGQPVNVEPLIKLDPAATAPERAPPTVAFNPNRPKPNTLDDVYVSAGAAKPEFDSQLHEIAASANGKPITVELKGRPRAEFKAATDYGGDISRLKDILRGTIEVRTPEQAQQVISQITRRFDIEGKPRNLLDTAVDPEDGYRDAKFNVRIGDTVAEIQVNLPQMLEAKSAAHHLYEARQKIERQAISEERALTSAEHEEVQHLNSQMRAHYTAAWTRSLSEAATSVRNSTSEIGAPFRRMDSGEKGLDSGVSNARQTEAIPGPYATGVPSTSQNRTPDSNFGRDILTSNADSIPPRVDMTDVRKAAGKQPLSILADERASKAADAALAQPVVDDITRVQQDLADELARLKEAGIDTTEALAPYDQAIADAKTYAKAARAAVLCGLGHAA